MTDKSQNRSLHDVEIVPSIVEAWEQDRAMVEEIRELEDRVLEHSNKEHR